MKPRKCTITAKQDISLFKDRHRYLKAENHEGYFHGLFGESDADGSSITIAFEHEDGRLVFLPECYFSLRFSNHPPVELPATLNMHGGQLFINCNNTSVEDQNRDNPTQDLTPEKEIIQ